MFTFDGNGYYDDPYSHIWDPSIENAERFLKIVELVQILLDNFQCAFTFNTFYYLVWRNCLDKEQLTPRPLLLQREGERDTLLLPFLFSPFFAREGAGGLQAWVFRPVRDSLRIAHRFNGGSSKGARLSLGGMAARQASRDDEGERPSGTGFFHSCWPHR